MAILSILTYPHPTLRKKAQNITVFDAQLAKLSQDMIDTMYDDEGVGLAANQVGITQRIIVVDACGEDPQPYVLINPEIIAKNGIGKSQEGCLSMPEIYIEINRAIEITIKAQDIKGNEIIMTNLDGQLAQCIQHEIDHLDGILFFDYLSPLKRQLIEKKLRKMACRT